MVRGRCSTTVSVVAALFALALGLAGCPAPEVRDLVGARREARMTANQLHNLGLAHLEAGDWPACERVYREVVRRKRMPGAYANLGYCRRQAGRLEAALDAYDAAAQSAPEDPEVLLGLGITLVLLGRSDAAEAVDARLGALDPGAAAVLARALRDGREPRTDRRLGVFPGVPTPRQAPLGIMGD